MKIRKLLICTLLPFMVGSVHATDSKNSSDSAHSLSKSAIYNLMMGELALNRQQYSSALNYYLEEIDSINDPLIAARAIELALYEKRYDDMLIAAKALLRISPDDPSSHHYMAIAHAYKLETINALESMKKALNLGSETDFTQIVYLLPFDHPSEEFFRNELTQLSILNPKNFDLLLSLAMIYDRRGEKEQVIYHTEKALKYGHANLRTVEISINLLAKNQAFDQVLSAYKLALQNNPANDELRRSYANFAIRQDLDIAKQQFNILLQQYPDDDQVLMKLALIYLEEENYHSAEQILKELIHLKKRTSSAYFYLGLIEQDKGDLAKALHYLKLVSGAKEKARASEHIIQIYMIQGDFEAAERLIKQRLELVENEEQNEALYMLLADTYDRQGKHKQAYELLTQLLQKNPDSIELRYNRAMMLADSDHTLTEMESDLRHIISIRPDNAYALNALGYTLADRTNRYSEALELIKQAHELLPDDPSVLDSLGWVLFRMGRAQEALAYLENAIQKLPDAEVAAHLGEVLWSLGKRDDAIKVFREALQSSPGHSKLLETIERLNVTL